MSYFVNKYNQKIAYKYIKGKSPGIVFIHGLNSNMNGEKALSIEKFCKKKGHSFLRFDFVCIFPTGKLNDSHRIRMIYSSTGNN